MSLKKRKNEMPEKTNEMPEKKRIVGLKKKCKEMYSSYMHNTQSFHFVFFAQSFHALRKN